MVTLLVVMMRETIITHITDEWPSTFYKMKLTFDHELWPQWIIAFTILSVIYNVFKTVVEQFIWFKDQFKWWDYISHNIICCCVLWPHF
jgi:hypothetical protein